MPTLDAASNPVPTTPLPFPPLARLRFRLEAEDSIRLPDFPGSAWRGVLGHALRRTACVTRAPTCAGCLLSGTCVYSTLFETPGDPATGDGHRAPPHPYVLVIDPQAPRRLDPGAPFELGITLMGAALAQVPYLIHAMGLAGQLGFGRARSRFTLTGVLRETVTGASHWQEVYGARDGIYHPLEPATLIPPPAPNRLCLNLVTPLRIKRDGHFLGARDLTAADLVQALYRRLRTLARLQGGDPGGFDLHRAAAATPGLRLTPQRLVWHDWTRYSSRQDNLMLFGGLLGQLTLEGESLPDLWPAFWLGQWTHAGKGTAFGLGCYRVLPADWGGVGGVGGEADDKLVNPTAGNANRQNTPDGDFNDSN